MTGLLLLACMAAAPTSGSRVVSLHDTTTEMVALLSQTDQLVAITEPGGLSEASGQAVASVPTLPSGQLGAEAILALRPTLVLGTDVVAEQQPALVAQLRSLGVEVHLVDPAGLDGLWRTMEEVGGLLGADDEARAWIQSSRANLPEPPAGDPVGVFIYDCCDPPFTAGGTVPLSELLTLMGARNVFEDQDTDWVAVSWEAVAQREPELVIIHEYAWRNQGDADTKREHLAAHPLASTTPAVESNRFVVLPLALSLEGPRTLEALPLLQPHIDAVRRAR